MDSLRKSSTSDAAFQGLWFHISMSIDKRRWDLTMAGAWLKICGSVNYIYGTITMSTIKIRCGNNNTITHWHMYVFFLRGGFLKKDEIVEVSGVTMAFRTDYEVAPFLVECLSSLPLPFLLLVSMRVTAHGADLTDPRFWFDNPTRCELSQQTSSGLVVKTGRPTVSLLFWSNYSNLTRPHHKWWFSKGNPLFQGNPGWWTITIGPDY